MIRLPESANAANTSEFEVVFKRKLKALAVDQLPLQQGLRVGSQVLDDGCSIMILSMIDAGEVIRAGGRGHVSRHYSRLQLCG